MREQAEELRAVFFVSLFIHFSAGGWCCAARFRPAVAPLRAEPCSAAWRASKSLSECGGGHWRSVRRGSSRLTPVQPVADEAPPSLQDQTLELHSASPQDPKSPPQNLGLGSAGLASAAQRRRRFFETAARLKGGQSRLLWSRANGRKGIAQREECR